MAAFSYQALDANSKLVKGVVEGDSERQVRNQLRAQSLKPLRVEVSNKKASGQGVRWQGLLQPRIGRADLALMTRQLATLIQSGLPVADALKATARQSRKPKIASLLLDIRGRILEGHSLAQALGERPTVFNDMYRATVRAGESAGYLGPVLARLADYIETGQHRQQKLRMAMIYPMVLLSVAILVIAALMTFVMPKLVGIFRHSERALPPLTEALIATSDFMVNYGHWLLVLCAVLVLGTKQLLKQSNWRLRWHRLLLRVPILSGWIISLESARLAGTLAILLDSGVPLLEALRISGQVPTNLVLRQHCADVATLVQEGGSLSKAMEQSNLFPPMLVEMAASGEASGDLGGQLGRAADNQERELELLMGAVLSLLEPLMVVLMGGAVMVIVLAILLPIFDINNLVR